MRHTYQLTDQTRRALKGHVSEIASEMEVADKYIYAFLAGTQTDPFALFRSLFKAIARVNPHGAREYLNDLKTIVEKEAHRGYTPHVDISDLSGKIGKEYVEFIESQLKNKPLDIQRRELRDIIEAACETMERLDELEAQGNAPKIRRA